MKDKKISDKIEEKIISFLEEGPKTITEIREKTGSNWLTIEKFLKKLREEEKVKELISTDKKKLYQLTYPETYFEIPISISEKEKFHALYSLILERYKELKKIPTKTEFAKVAVDVINDSDELKDLPTIWYFYGIIPLMAAEPAKSYIKEIEFKHEVKIKNSIKKYIDEKEGMSAVEIKKEQHKKYKEMFYVYCDDFEDATKNEWNEDIILESLNRAYIACPVDNEFRTFDYFDEFNIIVNKLFYLKIDKSQYKRELILTFDALWKYLATYQAYKSIKRLGIFKDSSEILKYYIGSLMEAREISLKESLSDINSIYLNNLRVDTELKTSDEIDDIRNILEDLY
ncbi:MAG: winged helix-turn-helix domain-containing protein [Bacteroidales bacterium]|jgi:hypothetical protein|nr:winged helix-turn-helix domain-containing protein [Bacteroidales bacterium]